MSEIALTPLQRLALAFYAFFAILLRADVAVAMARVREQHRAGALPPPSGASGVGAARPGEPAWTEPKPPATPASQATVVAKPAPAAKEAAPAPAPPSPAAPPPASAKAAPVPSLAPAAAPAAAKAPEPRVDGRPGDARGAALQLLAALQREGRLVDFVEEDLAGFPDASIGAAARTVHAGCKKVIHELFQLEPVYREAEGATVTVGAGFDPSAIRLTGKVVGAPPFKGALRHHGWRAREVKLPSAPDGKDPAIVAPAEVEL